MYRCFVGKIYIKVSKVLVKHAIFKNRPPVEIILEEQGTGAVDRDRKGLAG